VTETYPVIESLAPLFSFSPSQPDQALMLIHSIRVYMYTMYSIFELCRRTQQPSLTFHPVGSSTFGLWENLGDGGKWTEMTATQHGGTLRH
jgi:hypothetical protein